MGEERRKGGGERGVERGERGERRWYKHIMQLTVKMGEQGYGNVHFWVVNPIP